MNKHNKMYSFIEFLYMLFFLVLVEESSPADYRYEACAPRACGNLNISFPFYINGLQEPYCGYPEFGLNCSSSSVLMIHIPDNDYVIDHIFYQNRSLRVLYAAVTSNRSNCLPQIRNTTDPENFYFAETAKNSSLHLLSNCSKRLPGVLNRYRNDSCDEQNGHLWGLAIMGDDRNLETALGECRIDVLAHVDAGSNGTIVDFEGLLRKGFVLNWMATDCSRCESSGGRCGFNTSGFAFQCFCPDRPHFVQCQSRSKRLGIILGSVGAALVLFHLAIFLICHRKKGVNVFRSLISRKTSGPSTNLELEGGSFYFGVSVFSYAELEEATHNFDASRELGDGGFGTVYYGKLRDGREVAVKRLYEHNFKRMEQFKNEIKMLTRLRHRNLVTLYGCTSRHSRELLLVYEYVPNGTVADHIHGDRTKPKYLTWSHRMKIAIETADALAYLHASDTIHRDVKTDNILLDHNFCVKVADFGLSRLFPNDVTHISTAPQGTPGYVDPEYHQCYQLTSKSDVYSFGVVLIELISSMLAVDITRHRHEINLANLAINRIQRCAFDELIDPGLGYKTDAEVSRMTNSVAELAFRCVQGEKEMRPTMEEVLESLKEIQDWKENSTDNAIERVDSLRNIPRASPSPESEDRGFLKNLKFPTSPDSVTNVWVSSSTTASTSS